MTVSIVVRRLCICKKKTMGNADNDDRHQVMTLAHMTLPEVSCELQNENIKYIIYMYNVHIPLQC